MYNIIYISIPKLSKLPVLLYYYILNSLEIKISTAKQTNINPKNSFLKMSGQM